MLFRSLLINWPHNLIKQAFYYNYMSSKCYIWRCVESTFDLKSSGFRVVAVAGKACPTPYDSR